MIPSPPSSPSGVVDLGRTTDRLMVDFQGEQAELAMTVHVTTTRTPTRETGTSTTTPNVAGPRWHRYEATFTLLLHDGTRHPMGLVDGYHIQKPSAAHPHRNAATWRRDWLQSAWKLPADDDAEADMTYALRALYKRTGAPRAPQGSALAEGLQSDAGGDEMVFVQKVWVRRQSADGSGLRFSGRGLLKHVLGMYYGAFCSTRAGAEQGNTELPEELRVVGNVTFFLEPGYLEDEEQSAAWQHLRPTSEHPTEKEEHEFLQEVVRQLEAIYTRPSIGYEVRVRDAKVRQTEHTILARRIVRPSGLPSPLTSDEDDRPLCWDSKKRRRQRSEGGDDDDDEDEGPHPWSTYCERSRLKRRRRKERDER